MHRNEVTTYDRNGIVIVRATGIGVSLLTFERIEREGDEHKGSYLWRLPANYPLPPGLVLVADTRRQPPDHYFLCLQFDMPVVEYIALLSKLALNSKGCTSYDLRS